MLCIALLIMSENETKLGFMLVPQEPQWAFRLLCYASRFILN